MRNRLFLLVLLIPKLVIVCQNLAAPILEELYDEIYDLEELDTNSFQLQNDVDYEEFELVLPQLRPKAQRSGGDLIQEGDFVQRSGARFVVRSKEDQSHCETFYFVGWNTYYLMLRAANSETRYQVLEVLDDAMNMGLTVLRTWAFSDGSLQWHGMQRYPGFYDEATLRGLDFVLHEASKRGLRVILVFANYWQHYGGIDQYNIWSYQSGHGTCNGEFSCRDEFFTDEYATGFYKMHIRELLNRKNTYNGRVYKNDPAIFGYNLMNEPRSKVDYYVITRQSNDPTIGYYNITYNNGSALQSWIEDVAEFVKYYDPVHLLTTGQEGFFGESTPLYLYANPGAWAAYQGNDFVRNHQVPGIDYATMHVYVDQWLCDVRGASKEGWMDFYKKWIEAHQEAAEEDLQMPVVLEEFGGKLEDNMRFDLFKFAFESQLSSARRGGSFGGVMFWVLYHLEYEPMNDYGGGYGMYLHSSSPEIQSLNKLIYNQIMMLNMINEASPGEDTCIWHPSWPQGLGCRGLGFQFVFGGMPWECLPGEEESMESFDWCNAMGRVDLYRDPPVQWIGLNGPEELPFNTIEILIMGRIINLTSRIINLKDSYFVIPFSGGVHTILEGVWERVFNPNDRFQVFCWYLTIFNADGESQFSLNLCDRSQGYIDFEFSEIQWPVGVQQDRGLKVTFLKDIYVNPGGYVAASEDGRRVMFSFKDESLYNRLDVSSLSVQGSTSCPYLPMITEWPPPHPPSPPPCIEGKHPFRSCPLLEWYTPDQPAVILPVEPPLRPCQFEDCPRNTYNPYGTFQPENIIVQSASIPRHAHIRSANERGSPWTEEKAQAVLDAIFHRGNIYFNSSFLDGKIDFAQQFQMKPLLIEGILAMDNQQRAHSKLGLSSRYLQNDPSALVAGARSLEAFMNSQQQQNMDESLNVTDSMLDTEPQTEDQDLESGTLDDIEEDFYTDTYSISRKSQNSQTVQIPGQHNRRLLQTEPEFFPEDFVSQSNFFNGFDLRLQIGELYVISAKVSASGTYRKGADKLNQTKEEQFDDGLSSEIVGLQFLGYDVQSVEEEDIGRTAQDSTNLEDSGAEARGGLPVYLVAEMRSQEFWGETYRTIAKGVVIPNKDQVLIRGIFQISKAIKDIQIYAEVPVAGLKVELEEPIIQNPLELSKFVLDEYTPCALDPDHSPDGVMAFNATENETWNVRICSRGYGQNLRIFKDGELLVQFGEGFGFWELEQLPVSEGSRYHFVIDGDDHGLPYGSYRGGAGLHIIRNNGKPFQKYFDAKQAPEDLGKFVYAKNGKFWQGCQRFTYVGANTWDLMDIARYNGRLKEIDARFDAMKASNMTVARIWSFLVGRGATRKLRSNRLQLTPGTYNESVFRNLDYILDAARKRDMKLIIAIEDFWLSLTPYIEWVDSMFFKTDFYTDWRARTIYKNHVRNIVHRVNTYNGIKYLDDPTIMAWNLINEPRCTNCGGNLQAWIDEMALYLDALDPNHMITVGEEGFYSSTCNRVHINPGAGTRRTGIGSSPWALQEGQDFVKNHAIPQIDFATVHIWSDNWLGHVDFCGHINQNKGFDYSFGCQIWKEKLDYTKKWLLLHIEDANKLGKPLIVEEFGKTVMASRIADFLLDGERANEGPELRDWFFKAVYQEIELDMQMDGNTQGSNFWNFYLGVIEEEDPYRVTPDHNSTLQIIQQHAENILQYQNQSLICT